MEKIKNLPGGGFIKLNIDNLLNIRQQMARNYVTRVGVLGSKTNRLAPDANETHASYKKRATDYSKEHATAKAGQLTNAEVGFIQENGSYVQRIPRRSFLKMPLTLKMPDYYARLGPALIQALKNGDIRQVYVNLGIKGEQIVQEAFASRGFGQWAPNAPRTIAQKGSSQPLIDTAQLRKSITSDVVTK